MAEFRVVIEGLEMDAKSTKTLNDAIQKVVLDHLAGFDLTTGRNPRGVAAFRPRPEWYGIIAQVVPQKELSQLKSVEKTMQQFR